MNRVEINKEIMMQVNGGLALREAINRKKKEYEERKAYEKEHNYKEHEFCNNGHWTEMTF